jgi:hypothetical protein
MSSDMQFSVNTEDQSDTQPNADFARVEIDTPFDKNWLEDFLKDPLRLLRINSLFEFSIFEKIDDQHWHMVGKNLSNEEHFDVTFKANHTQSGLLLTYKGWLKTSTEIRIEVDDKNDCRLIITDDYSGTSEEERKQRVGEVDNTIVQWANDIYSYLQKWKRWSWLPGWKLYALRFWQNMKPSARRISFMLIALTSAEFVIFLFVFVIFWLELPVN